ncbi:MAG: formate dehydrogenase subunit alpha, partial [bacterium]
FPGAVKKADLLPAWTSDMAHGFRADHPYLGLDLASCIVCSRCVRACDEVQGSFALTLQGRGNGTVAVPGAAMDFNDSDCVSCGACANTCPTGAIFDKGYLEANTHRADREVMTTCSYCGVGCSLIVELKDEKVFAVKPATHGPSNKGHLCLKGRFAFRYASSPDRLTTPLIRNKATGELEPATWDTAIAHIASEFTRIRNIYGPDGLAGISSARGTNEESFLMQKFMRAVLGTNNMDCCARVCHSPTAYGMRQTFGTGAATNSYEDLESTRLVMIVGANPTHGHPVMGARIKQAVLNGAKLIVIDPRRTELAAMAEYHLALRPGTNVALLSAMAHVIAHEGLADQAFIDANTEGWPDYQAAIAKTTPEWAAPITGVSADLIRSAARAYATSGASMMFHGLGVSEHLQGSYGVMLLADLAMMTGNIGKPGVGVNPLRGQNNVQGAADMGAQPDYTVGYQHVSDPATHAKIQAEWGIALNQVKGLKLPEMYDAMLAGSLKALWVIGEDMAQTDPDTSRVTAALAQLEFLVVQELFLTETCARADVVLPGASFLEKTGTFTNAERRVQLIHEIVPPLGDSRPDWVIIQDIANAMGAGWTYTHPREVLDEIGRLDAKMGGISYDRLVAEDGLQWPCPTPDHPGTSIVHVDGAFTRGKGQFVITDFIPTPEATDTDFPFVMTTGRLLQHYNAGTMTRRTSNVSLVTRDVMEMHPADAARLGIGEGEYVKVVSRRGAVCVAVDVTTNITVGTLFLTFHFPEILINLITSDVREVNTLCPEYKVVAVRVEKISAAEQEIAEARWLERAGAEAKTREGRRMKKSRRITTPLPVAE